MTTKYDGPRKMRCNDKRANSLSTLPKPLYSEVITTDLLLVIPLVSKLFWGHTASYNKCSRSKFKQEVGLVEVVMNVYNRQFRYKLYCSAFFFFK